MLALAKSSQQIENPSVLRDKNSKYFGVLPENAPVLYMDPESIKLRMDIIDKMSVKEKAQIAQLRQDNPEAYAQYLLDCQMIPWTKQSQRGGVKAIMKEKLRLAMIENKMVSVNDPQTFKELVTEYQNKSPISRWERLILGTGQPPFLDSSKDTKTNGRLLRDHLGSDEKFYAFQVAEGKMTIKEAMTAMEIEQGNDKPVFTTIRNEETVDLLSQSSLADMGSPITLGDKNLEESKASSSHIGQKPMTQIPSTRYERTYDFMDDKKVYHEGVPESHLVLREIHFKTPDGTFETKKHPEGIIVSPDKIPYKDLSDIKVKKAVGSDYRKTLASPINEAPKTAKPEDIEKIVFRMTQPENQKDEKIAFRGNVARHHDHNCSGSSNCPMETIAPNVLKPR